MKKFRHLHTSTLDSDDYLALGDECHVIAPPGDASIMDGLCAAPGKLAHVFNHPLEAPLDPEL